MVPGKLFIKDGFQDGAPCPGQIKGNRKMANKLPDTKTFKNMFGNDTIFICLTGTC
jgi:hypothetical protein